MGNEFLLFLFVQLLISFGIFVGLVYVTKFIINMVESSRFKNSRFLNPLEYLPFEEVSTLKQVFYLVMITVFIMIDLYLIFGWDDGVYFISVLDIIISIYLAITMSKDSFKDKIILFLLIPFASIAKLIFVDDTAVLFDFFHIFSYLYFIPVYYRKFEKYTESHGLGITIILLYSIIFVSFIFTIWAENVSPLDSITMVSNAFTSNSFEASGNSVVGKLNSLVLSWGGFILSGVGTATLAVSIILKYVDCQFDEMETLIKRKKKEK